MKKFKTRPQIRFTNIWKDKNTFNCLFEFSFWFHKNDAGYWSYDFNLCLFGFQICINRKFY